MNDNPDLSGTNNDDGKLYARDFIFKLFKKYHTHIFDFASHRR